MKSWQKLSEKYVRHTTSMYIQACKTTNPLTYKFEVSYL